MKRNAIAKLASSLFLLLIADSSYAQDAADTLQNGNRFQAIGQTIIQFSHQIKLPQTVYIVTAAVSLIAFLLCLIRHKKVIHMIDAEQNKVIDSETMRSAQTIRELINEE